MRRTLFPQKTLKPNKLEISLYSKPIKLLKEYLSEPPIGETDNFIWLATPIGIAALTQNNDSTITPQYEQAIKEGLKIGIDLSREEKEFYQTEKGLIMIFYS